MAETVLRLARKAGEHLGSRGVENARLEAELLLAAVLGVKRLDLYLQHDRPVSADELAAFRTAVRRRLRREPIQYITGETAFRTLRLTTDRRALIPRPETEVLVGEVLAWAGGRDGALAALDVGTGSGNIAFSLVVEGPFARVVATDISAAALALARENAQRLGLQERVELREGPLFETVRPGERFDVVVSNPPYIGESEKDGLAPEVREHEPAEALFAGAGGLGVLHLLIDGAPDVLMPGGLLALEIAPHQAAALSERLRGDRRYAGHRVAADLAGRLRVVLATTVMDNVRTGEV